MTISNTILQPHIKVGSHKPCSRPVFTARVHGPGTRAVNTARVNRPLETRNSCCHIQRNRDRSTLVKFILQHVQITKHLIFFIAVLTSNRIFVACIADGIVSFTL